MFTYEEYRWAVGIVMSRQNYVPVNGTPQICLIPLWDMLNHDEGVVRILRILCKEIFNFK